MLTYVWNIIKMQITDEEMAIYTSSLLLCPHRSGLCDVDRISGMHRALNDALQNNVSTKLPEKHYTVSVIKFINHQLQTSDL